MHVLAPSKNGVCNYLIEIQEQVKDKVDKNSVMIMKDILFGKILMPTALWFYESISFRNSFTAHEIYSENSLCTTKDLW